MTILTLLGRIPVNGARAVEPFEIDGVRYLAIPQLSTDMPGTAANMNGGDSTLTAVRILRRTATGAPVLFEDFQDLPVHGGEDAEFFTIGDRAFLAIANIRDGSGPYDYAQPQRIYEWDGARFAEFQQIPGYAAKQWRHFMIEGTHFLALAQGVSLPDHEQGTLPSRIYKWTGEGFEFLQDVQSAWGYNWHHFQIAGVDYLAYADHVAPSILLRWSGKKFEIIQALADQHGRAFADFSRGGQHYLAVARLQSPSEVLRWDGERFVPHQTLPEPGGREWRVIERGAELYLVRVNFIGGTQHDPITALHSQVYRWRDGRLETAEEFETTGGTDAAVWDDAEHGLILAVSNSLTADVRFSAGTDFYRFSP